MSDPVPGSVTAGRFQIIWVACDAAEPHVRLDFLCMQSESAPRERVHYSFQPSLRHCCRAHDARTTSAADATDDASIVGVRAHFVPSASGSLLRCSVVVSSLVTAVQSYAGAHPERGRQRRARFGAAIWRGACPSNDMFAAPVRMTRFAIGARSCWRSLTRGLDAAFRSQPALKPNTRSALSWKYLRLSSAVIGNRSETVTSSGTNWYG
jgi:hypothetical protein